MNEGDVIGVECPCCRGELYQQVLVATAPGEVWARSTSSPKIEDDDKGRFMTCRHCQRKIRLIEVPAPASGKGLQIDPKQKCD